MTAPPNWLRWVLVVPVAVCAYVVLTMIGSVVTRMLPIPSFILTLYYSAMSPLAFVAAGVVTAPGHKFVTALVLTVINAIFAAVIVTMAVIQQTGMVPLWWLVVCAMIGIVATVGLCNEFREDA
jgi:hypothetical protein